MVIVARYLTVTKRPHGAQYVTVLGIRGKLNTTQWKAKLMQEQECWWRLNDGLEWEKGRLVEWQVHQLNKPTPSYRSLKTVTCGLIEDTR